MGKGESQEWTEEEHDTKRTQPERQQSSREGNSSGGRCPTCCLRTRDCLMSPECGRALQISSVVAWCGTCIRMWVCECCSSATGGPIYTWGGGANMPDS